MKTITFLLYIFSSQAFFSQGKNNIFLEPLLNVKTTVISKNDISIPANSSLFELKPIHYITPIGFNIGMNLGYKFKNNNILQIGIFQDEALSGVTFSANEMLPNSNTIIVGQRKYSHYGGVKTKNINAIFKKELFSVLTNTKNKSYFSIYFNLGVTYFYKPNNGLENLTGTDGFAYYSIDSNYVQFTNGIWVFPLPFKYSFKYNLGFEFVFGNAKSELFSLSLSYISNFSKTSFYSFTSGEVRVTDKYNKTTMYPYHVIGRGNGIYYQISKRFYPFKLIENRALKKMKISRE